MESIGETTALPCSILRTTGIMAFVRIMDVGEKFFRSPSRPHVSHQSSDYGLNGVKAALAKLPTVLRPLPVERIEVRQIDGIAVHLQGTLRMGFDASESVVDADQVHHNVRNLLVVGSSVFPSSGSAPPSLTVAAMSLRAARLLKG
jgi:choline dehydrogenase-like flavoprotein